ncbi:hypothetical protein [Metabacillus herbersteinensis]|uniref:hypothetical protein n=1 Tax=Metabacillus herbersteinensis TaxID=283816 RepID=UPI00366B4C7C
MRLVYKPIVHIEKVKPKKESADFVEIEEVVKNYCEQKVTFEVSKYPVKDTDEAANDAIDVMAYWHKKLHRSKIIFYFRRE